jgi:hypothetical protein
MNIEKFFLRIVSVPIYLYVTVWTFNHINAWVGIGVFVLGLYISAKLIFKTKK